MRAPELPDFTGEEWGWVQDAVLAAYAGGEAVGEARGQARAYEHGRGDGLLEGIELGRAQAGREWTDLTVTACRGALPLAGLAEARRRQYAEKPKTPEQLLAAARSSWRRVERRIDEQQEAQSA